MAVLFQIDGSDFAYDPQAVDPEPVEWIGRKHGGGPLVNVFRSVRLSFEGLNYTDFTTLSGKCDSSAHTIKIPNPNTGTYTTYTGVYLHLMRWSFKDINAYDIEVVVDHITVA